MGPDVHLQGSQADILLFTVLAAEGFSRLGVAVELLVFSQSRESGVRLAAQVASKLLRVRGVLAQAFSADPLLLVAARGLRAVGNTGEPLALGLVPGAEVGGRAHAPVAQGRRLNGGIFRGGHGIAWDRRWQQGRTDAAPDAPGIVNARSQNLRLRDDRPRITLVQVGRNDDCLRVQFAIIWLFAGAKMFLN